MRKSLEPFINEMIRIAKENPGKYSSRSLAEKSGVAYSTAHQYCNKFDLPIRRKKEYAKDQIEFVIANHKKMTQAEVGRAIGLQPYQVYDIARANKLDFKIRPIKPREESEFFEHDPYYSY